MIDRPASTECPSQPAWGLLGFCLFVVALMVFGMSLPPTDLYGGDLDTTATVHLFLELFSIVVSALLVIIAWQSLDNAHVSVSNVLIFGFSVVAGADLVHAFSYEGMPALWSANSTSKAIFFWLSGRCFELVAMTLLAFGISLPGHRLLWLGLGIVTVAVLTYIGNFHLASLPVMFVPGQEVTALKAAIEYVICAGNFLIAAIFYLRSNRGANCQALNLAVASFIIGVGEMAFTTYVATSDFIIVLGHVYKVIAYGFVFRVAFVTGLRQPYSELMESKLAVARQSHELETLLSNLPVAVMRLGTDLKYRYVNPHYERMLGKPKHQILGKSLTDLAPRDASTDEQAVMLEALKGNKVEFEQSYTSLSGEVIHCASVAVPERNRLGDVEGILTIQTDITERRRALYQWLQSKRELEDLRAALDAHAIVAVTDAQGVILHVNEKFCEISQYNADELVGKNHDLINSGHHPKSFFQDLWQTIKKGQIWNGEICNRAKDGSIYWVYTTIVPFLGSDGHPAQYIAIRADITQRKLAEQDALHSALHDGLTGLPNRRQMMAQLNGAVQKSFHGRDHYALFLFNMDSFKDVNDTLGHDVGDELLREVAARLLSIVGNNGTVARVGGDEFAVIVADLGKHAGLARLRAQEWGEQILESLRPAYQIASLTISTTQSAGVVLFNHTADTARELLKQVDIALHRAKQDGKNRLRFFDPSLQEEVKTRLSLVDDLRHAEERGELQLHYQAVVDASGKILGVEALLRWQHPERGMVSPAVFVPLAEQSNLILPIGDWVLRVACEQLAQWAGDPIRADWTVAVNVSARQLLEDDFVDKVRQTLASTGAIPYRLRLELTESMLQRDVGQTISKMRLLKSLGIRFALDDFGTGYSAMSYLKNLPLDQLKIDKAFVRDMCGNASGIAIVRTILSLAENLQLSVVAEGIESREQFDLLCEYGCHAFQGYLFSQPAADTSEWSSHRVVPSEGGDVLPTQNT